MALTAKQQRFVEEYPKDWNATQAAIRAGYSEKTAYSQGQRLLKNVEVAEAIEKKRWEIAKAANLDAKTVLQGLHLEATRMGEGSSHSARVNAWSHLGKHFNMFVDRTEISGPDGAPIQITETERAARLGALISKVLQRNGGDA